MGSKTEEKTWTNVKKKTIHKMKQNRLRVTTFAIANKLEEQ